MNVYIGIRQDCSKEKFGKVAGLAAAAGSILAHDEH